MKQARATSKPGRVSVPCCQCNQPTSMKVSAELFERVEIWHLCHACAGDIGEPEADPADESPDGD